MRKRDPRGDPYNIGTALLRFVMRKFCVLPEYLQLESAASFACLSKSTSTVTILNRDVGQCTNGRVQPTSTGQGTTPDCSDTPNALSDEYTSSYAKLFRYRVVLVEPCQSTSLKASAPTPESAHIRARTFFYQSQRTTVKISSDTHIIFFYPVQSTALSNVFLRRHPQHTFLPIFRRLHTRHRLRPPIQHNTAYLIRYDPSRHWCLLVENCEIPKLARLHFVARDKAGKAIMIDFRVAAEKAAGHDMSTFLT